MVRWCSVESRRVYHRMGRECRARRRISLRFARFDARTAAARPAIQVGATPTALAADDAAELAAAFAHAAPFKGHGGGRSAWKGMLGSAAIGGLPPSCHA